MKRKTPVKLIGYLLCVALLCGLLAGCGNDKVQEDQNDNVSADTIPEDVVVHTDYSYTRNPGAGILLPPILQAEASEHPHPGTDAYKPPDDPQSQDALES